MSASKSDNTNPQIVKMNRSEASPDCQEIAGSKTPVQYKGPAAVLPHGNSPANMI